MKNVRSAMCDVRCGRRRFYLSMSIGGSLLTLLAVFALWPVTLAVAAFVIFLLMTITPLIHADSFYSSPRNPPPPER